MIVEYFKASRDTKTMNSGQKVWIRVNYANHLCTWFKFRGKGRYVQGYIDKESPVVGEIKEIDVNENFAKRIYGERK